MEDIVNKMFDQGPKALVGDNIFLAAVLAIPSLHFGSAVQAVFFLSFGLVGHVKFFLKIGTISALHLRFVSMRARLSIFETANETPAAGACVRLWKNKHRMKYLFAPILLFLSVAAQAQFYYKDIIGTRETADLLKAYTANKVSRVTLNSYDENNTRTDLYIEQEFSPASQLLRTYTRSGTGPQSVLATFLDSKGNVSRTVDSNRILVTVTNYAYTPDGRLQSITTSSNDTANVTNRVDQHLWLYRNNRIDGMLYIKNGRDTTSVSFKFDEKGNVIEEKATRHGVSSEPYYYYYDNGNRLTDVVRYNSKARRLLPETMLYYDESNRVIQRAIVPANSDNYTIWRYIFDSRGLKTREGIFNKKSEMMGKVEYVYSPGS